MLRLSWWCAHRRHWTKVRVPPEHNGWMCIISCITEELRLWVPIRIWMCVRMFRYDGKRGAHSNGHALPLNESYSTKYKCIAKLKKKHEIFFYIRNAWQTHHLQCYFFFFFWIYSNINERTNASAGSFHAFITFCTLAVWLLLLLVVVWLFVARSYIHSEICCCTNEITRSPYGIAHEVAFSAFYCCCCWCVFFLHFRSAQQCVCMCVFPIRAQMCV